MAVITMMPAFIIVPAEDQDAYRVATVVAAIPLDSPRAYAVTAVDPAALLSRPAYIAAEVTRASDRDGSLWFADETTDPSPLADALGDMATLAGRVHPRML